MRKLSVLLSLLVLASLVLAACGGAAPATEAPPPAQTQPPAQEPEEPSTEPEEPAAPAGDFSSSDPNTYFRPSFGEPETLDPALDYETAGGEVISNIYETLVTYNRNSAEEFVPQLASEWTVSDDGTVYTFTIREGVTFHEGGELTPSDVAYTFQRGLLQG